MTTSGATAVQVVWSSRRGSRHIEHLGPAHDEAELEALKAAAQQRIAAGQMELALGPAGPGPAGPLPITKLGVDQMGNLVIKHTLTLRKLLAPTLDQAPGALPQDPELIESVKQFPISLV